MDHIHTFFTTQGHGGPPRMSDQPNAGATAETAQTWKTINTKHTLSHPNKANMEWWLWRPNDIRGPWGPKVSWHLSYRWGKTMKKPHPGNLSRPGIEPGPGAWQARMLPLAPQWWTDWFLKILTLIISHYACLVIMSIDCLIQHYTFIATIGSRAIVWKALHWRIFGGDNFIKGH